MYYNLKGDFIYFKILSLLDTAMMVLHCIRLRFKERRNLQYTCERCKYHSKSEGTVLMSTIRKTY